MGKYCAVATCVSGLYRDVRRRKELGLRQISLFRVPKNLDRRRVWSAAVGQELKDNARICDLHFLDSDVCREKKIILKDGHVDIWKNQIPRLRPNATPRSSATNPEEMDNPVQSNVANAEQELSSEHFVEHVTDSYEQTLTSEVLSTFEGQDILQEPATGIQDLVEHYRCNPLREAWSWMTDPRNPDCLIFTQLNPLTGKIRVHLDIEKDLSVKVRTADDVITETGLFVGSVEDLEVVMDRIAITQMCCGSGFEERSRSRFCTGYVDADEYNRIVSNPRCRSCKQLRKKLNGNGKARFNILYAKLKYMLKLQNQENQRLERQDIRSYFSKSPKGAGPSQKPKPKPTVIISSDEDDTKAKSPKKQPKQLSKRPGRKHALSDSEDEAPVQKKKEAPKDKQAKKEESLKPVTLSDVFGKKSISRVGAPVVSKKLLKKETEFHNDDAFEATLSQLDMSDLESKVLTSEPMVDKSSSKRKHAGESDEDVETKRIKKDETIYEQKKEDVNDKKKRRGSREEETDGNTKKKDGKQVIRDSTKNGTSNSPEKLKVQNVKKNKKTTEIVMEPKEEKKKKKQEREEEAEDQYAEAADKKKERATLYNKYLMRGGARNPGSKPIPTGAENCLAGLSFLITGVLDSLERDEADELIKKYGGRTVAALSKKTNYLVVGDDAGPAKLAKAASFGTKQISEDELLELIRSRPAGDSKNVVQPRSQSINRKKSVSPKKVEKSPSPKKVSPLTKFESTISQFTPKTTVNIKVERKDDSISQFAPKPEPRDSISTSSSIAAPKLTDDTKTELLTPAQALVDKYRPKTMKQIIGQHGDKSNAHKLHFWLKNWHKNQNGSVKLVRPSPWAKNDDGAFFKAALLSGPPGVGKTTSAEVVCRDLEFDLLEFNASDTRSKRLLKDEVSGILSNTTVKGYFTENSSHKLTKRHVLLMDEVDGMAGNEDRGGLQELIALIKSSEVPVICICNDRNHPKMRTLSNYTFDLRFQKPRIEQIRGAMKSLCCKEKIDISNEDLDHLIQSTNQDIRQVINHLAILSGGPGTHDKPKGRPMNKDLRLGPWDVIQKVFSAEEHAKMSIHDKSDLFFHDYNISALFVQENYLSVQPKAPQKELLSRVARAADSLAVGDILENAIRGSNAWSLLPTQACFSSVIPGSLMSGRMTARANFPAWLGRNSRRAKFDRLLQEITVHARLTTGASKEAINIDYLNHIRDSIVRPLTLRKNEGIDEALNVMNHYHLQREDLDSLMEVSLWPGQPDPMQAIESKVKAAFTRAYNKSSAPAPYVMNAAAPKKKTAQASQDEGFMDGEEEEDDEASDADEDDMNSDRMIKAKKATASDRAASSSKSEAKPKPKAPAKRGRGRGRGK